MFLGLARLRKRKDQNRGRPVHFIYRFQLLEIKPWLLSKQSSLTSQPSSFILRWRRGGHRSGFAQSGTVYNASCDGRIPFNHAFELPVTLYCSSSSSAFGEKLISFTLLDGWYSSGPPLARGTLSLAALRASGVDNSEPCTTTACIPLIPCGHVLSRAKIPNLHILITSSVCKRACSCAGYCQSKAQYLASYSPLRSVRLHRKPEPPLDHSSHVALVAALLKEEDEEHQDEDEEAEIEAFTDDESSSGLHTPHEADNGSTLHHKRNTTSVGDCGLPPASSRISVAQVAWKPTHKRPCSDEVLSSLQNSSEVYSSSEEAFFLSSRGVSPTNNHTSSANSPPSPSFANTGKQTQLEDIKLNSDDKNGEAIPLLHQDVKAREGQLAQGSGGKLTEFEHTIGSSELTNLKLESNSKDRNDPGISNHHRVSEAGALRRRILSQFCESKAWRMSLDDLDSEPIEDDDIISIEEDVNVLEEARRKFAEGTEKRDAKITKRLLEESKVKLAEAEAKCFAASEKVSYLQLCVGVLEGELQDVAAIEMFIFCTVAEHGGSPYSVLTCACHLAKLHNHAIANWSLQRRSSLMRSTLSGLILATRACGQDVARLTFWWSNVLALRHAFMLALNPLACPSSSESGLTDCAKPTVANKLRNLGSESCDWSDPTIFGAALQNVEAWIYARVVESIWWQAFAPLTQKSAHIFESVNKDDAVKNDNGENTSLVFDLEDGMQQNISIDIWKTAFLDAFQKLCPVRVGGKECSCIPGLPRLP